MANLTLYTTTACEFPPLCDPLTRADNASPVLLLDSDGDRVMAKYYQPPHAAAASVGQSHGPPQLTAKNPFGTVKEQKAFERAVWEKTRKSTGEGYRRLTCVPGALRLTSRFASAGDILLYDSHLVLFRSSLDVTFYVIGPGDENPLMLSGLMSAIFDSVSLLLRGQIEKRAILENLDLVTLAVDECVDDGCVHPAAVRE